MRSLDGRPGRTDGPGKKVMPPGSQRPAAGAGLAGDPISTIETELLTLVRHLDTLGRRNSLYVKVDRAGYLALRTLDRLGPQRTNDLAGALQLDASTVTRQVTALASDGLVERRPDPTDGRSSILAVTPAGRAAMGEVERERRAVLEEMFGGWDDDDRGQLGDALTKLNGALVDRVAKLSR
jgi:DNA-binding MarR family transcriptional regulator